MDNKASPNNINANNYDVEDPFHILICDQFADVHQSSGTPVSNENRITVPQASRVEAQTNSPNSQAQETMTQRTARASETANMEICIRNGCNKHAVMNPQWDKEYCSNLCAVTHCKTVFRNWLQQNH